MVSTRVIPTLLVVGALAASPASAQQEHRRRGGDQRVEPSAAQSAPRGERAAPREQSQREAVRPQHGARRDQAPPVQVQQPRRYDRAVPRQYDRRDNDRREYDRRDYRAPAPYYGSRGYGYGGYAYGHVSPRIIRPTIVTVVPYRPYVYRPSWNGGVYYGSGGYYPYGYTPRGYYDPIPGHAYGGLRISGMPRGAQVFADGYFVGLVDDFDGVFQHLNLEAGGHHIEIQMPGGYEPPIAFDVFVRPGETITYRATY